MAAVFALPGAGLFAAAIAGLLRRDVLIGPLAAAPLFAVVALGLWMRRGWGRTLAILVALANAGLAALALVATIAGGASPVGPALFAAVNAGIAVALSRPAFTLPGEP